MAGNQGGVTTSPNIVDQRREKMLASAAELIAERGFSDTRITDVAQRAGASPSLVIYYFGTKDKLLTEALRYSEDAFYLACADMLASTPDIRQRIERFVTLTCVPGAVDEQAGAWGLWFDLWAQAFRHPLVAKDRIDLDRRWRSTIASVVLDGVAANEISKVDAEAFALAWAALLDGLAIQVALEDPVVTPERAVDIAMSFAEQALGLPPAHTRRQTQEKPSHPRKGS